MDYYLNYIQESRKKEKMKTENNIKAIFFDVGGVCLTNGWDESSREKLAQEFSFDFEQTESVHANLFEDFERGEITLKEYIDKVYFTSEQIGNITKTGHH